MIDEYHQWNKEQQQPTVIYEILQPKNFSWDVVAYYYLHTLLFISKCYDVKYITMCAGSKMELFVFVAS
jgi:hypothetical protein